MPSDSHEQPGHDVLINLLMVISLLLSFLLMLLLIICGPYFYLSPAMFAERCA